VPSWPMRYRLRHPAEMVRGRYRRGSPAYGFWRVISGIWDRWAERMELGVDLTPIAHAEVFATPAEENIKATELSGRLLGHVCSTDSGTQA
jgi:hypothetical protein